ncbi:hypothetical protein D3C76_1366720 [compost metagenome]
MADAFAVLQHHGVDRANAAGFWRQFVEQRDDRLLARKGDVEAGEVHSLGCQQQFGQGVAVELQLIEIDQAIQITQILGIAFMLVQGRGAGSLDACADQACQYGLILAHHAHPFRRWLKCSSARR